MPAFLEAHFWDLTNPEFWVGVGLLMFFGVVWWKARAMIAGMLDAKATTIQTDLAEAARLRAEAEAMLADIRAQRVEAERHAAEMLSAAQADAVRLAAEAKIKLEEQIARRAALAERKIASAEAEAAAEVKAVAADLAAQAAEQILAARLTKATTDPSVDAAIKGMAVRLQ